MLISLRKFFLTKKRGPVQTVGVHDGNHDEPSSSGDQEQDLGPSRGKRTKTPKKFGPNFVSS